MTDRGHPMTTPDLAAYRRSVLESAADRWEAYLKEPCPKGTKRWSAAKFLRMLAVTIDPDEATSSADDQMPRYAETEDWGGRTVDVHPFGIGRYHYVVSGFVMPNHVGVRFCQEITSTGNAREIAFAILQACDWVDARRPK